MENDIKIDSLIKSFIKENNLENGLENVKVRDLWYEIMKNGVANYTTDINLINETLYIKLKSSVLREELSYGKEKIIKLLNKKLKKDLIKKIVLR
ncbi:MAG TPA: DciA family protein [Flavobacteriaceae bacterium]|nr:DciA family protein [Flavobacteriaceae bacterium]|tara:strand:+ start:1570 stop:1854 length:285 start_codon:yes stop_codon:yes gene_type:complete